MNVEFYTAIIRCVLYHTLMIGSRGVFMGHRVCHNDLGHVSGIWWGLVRAAAIWNIYGFW